ncbi:MAG TPA: hypothetical protein VI172_10810 [Candidatus Dormibacteraeota bacterium]|jgi:hypothetical protein
MTDTTVTPYPSTPAEVAAAVLDAIELRPDTLNMSEWYYHPDSRYLMPSDEPDCGTTMCVAGWAAHVVGWTLVNDFDATRGDETETIAFVATLALGLDDETDLFRMPAAQALRRLREIAGR